MRLLNNKYQGTYKDKSESADMLIRAALNAGKAMTFATSQPASWKAHFTKRFPDANIEECEGGLRISKSR